MKHITPIFAAFFTAILLITSITASADTTSPRDVITNAVDRMTQQIDAHRDDLKKNPNHASKLIEDEADKLLAFKRITRLVMGPWFGKASDQQRYHFLDVFKRSLIDTYAAGITLYDGQKIEVLPLRDNDIRDNKAFVRMQIGTNSGSDIAVSYTMIKQGDTWQVENIIVNGLNLGKTFQTQFDQSAKKYNGDIDKVIDSWAEQLKHNDAISEQTEATGDTAE